MGKETQVLEIPGQCKPSGEDAKAEPSVGAAPGAEVEPPDGRVGDEPAVPTDGDKTAGAFRQAVRNFMSALGGYSGDDDY